MRESNFIIVNRSKMKPRNQIALLKVIWRRCHLLQFLILVNIACFFSFLAYYSTIIRVRTSSMRLKSTCSEQADLRGPNQRIISYSVYGNLSDPYIIQRYLKPMLSNIENIHELYPGNNDLLCISFMMNQLY